MGTESNEFNLVDEPWIRVRLLRGSAREMSLAEIFHAAPEIRYLANDLPTQDFAILRVLLAIVERSVVPLIDEYIYPSELWGEMWRKRKLPINEIDEYLEEFRSCFDLMNDSKPFMQVSDLQATNGTISELKKLLTDVPDGAPLFSLKSGFALEQVSLAQAARWLVHLHAFDPSGIKTGVIGDPEVKGGKSYPRGTGWAGNLGGVYLEGHTLVETLLLNLVLGSLDPSYGFDEYAPLDDDLPVWEQGPKSPGDEAREPYGYADLYTWQSRRVRLDIHDGYATGVVLTNGNRLDAYNRGSFEPMTAWRRSLNSEKRLHISPVYFPAPHRAGRALWRGLSSILPLKDSGEDGSVQIPGVVKWANHLSSANAEYSLESDYRLRIHGTGFVYGTQNAVVTEMVDDVLEMSAFLLSPQGADAARCIEKNMESTDNAVRAFGRFASNLSLAAGDDAMRTSDVRRKAEAEAYFEVDQSFRSWLAVLGQDTDLDAASVSWGKTAMRILRDLAETLLHQASAEAIVGREVTIAGKSYWMTAGKAENILLGQLRTILLGQGDEKEKEDKDGARAEKTQK